MLNGADVRLGVDYIQNRNEFDRISDKIIYTGAIDEYFDYCLGELQYRSIRFDTKVLNTDNFQGNAVVNYTDRETPYTRIIEHKFFEYGTQSKTVISKEFSSEWEIGNDPYYPINDCRNNDLLDKYKELAKKQSKVIFGGRLGEYKYFDMDVTIESALKLCQKELNS